MFSENVRLRRVSVGAVSWSEYGGVEASAESLVARTAAACLLCVRR